MSDDEKVPTPVPRVPALVRTTALAAALGTAALGCGDDSDRDEPPMPPPPMVFNPDTGIVPPGIPPVDSGMTPMVQLDAGSSADGGMDTDGGPGTDGGTDAG